MKQEMKSKEEIRAFIEQSREDFLKGTYADSSYRRVYRSRYNERIWVLKWVLNDPELIGDEDYIREDE